MNDRAVFRSALFILLSDGSSPKRVMLGWRIGNLGTPEQIQALESVREVEVELPPGESQGLAWGHVGSPDNYHALIEFVPTLVVRKIVSSAFTAPLWRK